MYRSVFLIVLLGWGFIHAQDPERFREEVTELTLRTDSIWDTSKKPIIFTGSSSIRMWKRLREAFPDHYTLNTGFGGSQASDLLFYLDTLVLRYRPKQVFIYEGDNDIHDGKKPKNVLNTLKQIVSSVKGQYPDMPITLIGAKPSISRWDLRRKYRRLNKKIMRYSKKAAQVEYVDVWNIMLSNRKLKTDLFIEDGLHMNPKGYGLWKEVLTPYLKN